MRNTKKNISIANSELPIMKILWEFGELTSPEIFEHLDGNISTFKTLLKRLVHKGAVGVNEITSRTYSYYAILTRRDYIAYERKGFLRRAFDGSKKKMLLNFVKEENISRKDIEDLLELIEEE